MDEYILPVIYIGSMICFTIMRKVGLARYLKPHQITIALSVGWVVIASLLSAYEKVDSDSKMKQLSVLHTSGWIHDIFVFFPAQSLFAFALIARKEIDARLGYFCIAGLLVISVLFATECEHNVLLMALSAVFLLFGLKQGTRIGLLLVIWGSLGFSVGLTCYEDAPSPVLAYVFAYFSSLWVVKIAHSAFDVIPNLKDEESDLESGKKWSW